MTDILFLQTADPDVYREMLDLTASANRAYCERHGFGYRSWLGIRRGVCPWMACYNRIFLIQDLLAEGFRGWLVYLDADAFVRDITFDLRSYLAENTDHLMIGAPGDGKEEEVPWKINDGVFFFNMADPRAEALVEAWLEAFRKHIPDDFLANPASQWGQKHDDQGLLHAAFSNHPVIAAGVKKQREWLMNYTDGRFIRQAIRHPSMPTVAARVAWIREQVGHCPVAVQ